MNYECYELYLSLHAITIRDFKSIQTKNTQIFNLRVAILEWRKRK